MLNSSHILTFSFGVGVTILIMLGLGYQLDGDMGLCKLEAAGSAAETPATCLRSWLGALSGWVAAAGALGVGLPTIRFMRNQVKLAAVESQLTQNNETQRLAVSLKDWMKKLFSDKKSKLHTAEDMGEFSAHVYHMVREICASAPTSSSRRILGALPIDTCLMDAHRALRENKHDERLSSTQHTQISEIFLRSLMMRLWELETKIDQESEQLLDWKQTNLLS